MRTGVVRGETKMPERDPRVPPYVRGDRLYLVERDADGLQSVRVFRIGFASR
jgi:hypothetical protein